MARNRLISSFNSGIFRELGEISGLQLGGIQVVAEIVGQLARKFHHVRQRDLEIRVRR